MGNPKTQGRSSARKHNHQMQPPIGQAKWDHF